MNSRKAMKASELVAALQKRIEQFGDLEISVSTQDGSAYSLLGIEDISVVSSIAKDGKLVIAVTHSQDVANHGTRIVHLADGVIDGDQRDDHDGQAYRDGHQYRVP